MLPQHVKILIVTNIPVVCTLYREYAKGIGVYRRAPA